MWQTKYAAAIPKNLGLGLNFRPCSEGYFLSVRPQSVLIVKRNCRNISPKYDFIILSEIFAYVKNVSKGLLRHQHKSGAYITQAFDNFRSVYHYCSIEVGKIKCSYYHGTQDQKEMTQMNHFQRGKLALMRGKLQLVLCKSYNLR